MVQVTGSASTTTGVAPARTIAAAQEIIVKVGKMTSSSRPMPNAAIAISSAPEPLLTAIPYLRSTLAANCASNLLTNGPSDEIQPVVIHSAKYFARYHLTGVR